VISGTKIEKMGRGDGVGDLRVRDIINVAEMYPSPRAAPYSLAEKMLKLL
jgi:hypothetical protein